MLLPLTACLGPPDLINTSQPAPASNSTSGSKGGRDGGCWKGLLLVLTLTCGLCWACWLCLHSFSSSCRCVISTVCVTLRATDQAGKQVLTGYMYSAFLCASLCHAALHVWYVPVPTVVGWVRAGRQGCSGVDLHAPATAGKKHIHTCVCVAAVLALVCQVMCLHTEETSCWLFSLYVCQSVCCLKESAEKNEQKSANHIMGVCILCQLLRVSQCVRMCAWCSAASLSVCCLVG